MRKTKFNIEKVLKQVVFGPSKWELDNIVWHDRTTNPDTLKGFLKRIVELKSLKSPTAEEARELTLLLELANELDEKECLELLSNTDEIAQQTFFENLSRRSAMEVLTDKKISHETMSTMCKLSPEDFIIVSKRTQDLINAITALVIQGETLSRDVAGA